MNIIIIVAVIAVFFINLIFIDKIYKIVDPPAENIYDSNHNIYINSKDALIYGEEKLSKEVSKLLTKNNITSEILIDIEKLEKSYQYQYLFALNNKDLENLMACTIATKIMGITNIIAICNMQYNKKLYEENHILYLNSNSSASEIVFALLSYQNKRET